MASVPASGPPGTPKTLLIDREHGHLRVHKGRILVEENGHPLMSLSVRSVTRILCVGNISPTPAAVSLLLREGIPLVFLSVKGRYKGTVEGPASRNTLVRFRQMSVCFGEGHRTAPAIATAIVRAKLGSMVRLLRSHKADPAVTADLLRLRDGLTAPLPPSVLRGIEGTASHLYFHGLGPLVRNPAFVFVGRNRRPPKDRLNAMLSYGYAILLSDVVGLLKAYGLDPAFGFYHEFRPGRPALGLDMMELCRHGFVDALVLALVNKGMVDEECFEHRGGGVFLNKRGRTRWMEAYEKMKVRTVATGKNGGPVKAWHRMEEKIGRLVGGLHKGDIEVTLFEEGADAGHPVI